MGYIQRIVTVCLVATQKFLGNALKLYKKLAIFTKLLNCPKSFYIINDSFSSMRLTEKDFYLYVGGSDDTERQISK